MEGGSMCFVFFFFGGYISKLNILGIVKVRFFVVGEGKNMEEGRLKRILRNWIGIGSGSMNLFLKIYIDRYKDSCMCVYVCVGICVYRYRNIF